MVSPIPWLDSAQLSSSGPPSRLPSQVYKQIGDVAPDLESTAQLKAMFEVTQALLRAGKVLVRHVLLGEEGEGSRRDG